MLIQVDAWTKEGGSPNCRALCFVFGKISPFVPPAPHGVRGGSIRATAYLLAPVPPASSTSPPVADWGGCSDILGSFEDRGVSRSHEHTCPHPIGHFFPFWIELWTIRKGMVGMRLMHDYLVFGDYFFIHSGWRWQKGESYNAIFGIPSHFYPQSALFAARGGNIEPRKCEFGVNMVGDYFLCFFRPFSPILVVWVTLGIFLTHFIHYW